MNLLLVRWLCIFSLLLLCFACEQRADREVQVDEQTFDSLRVELQGVNDSLYRYWNEMMTDEEQKLQYVRRLLQELSYRDWPDSTHIHSLNRLRDSVANLRYTEPQEVSSAKIDAYDAATQKMIDELTALRSAPGLESCSLCLELLEDITRLDEETLPNRSHYDEQAIIYNLFVEQNKDKLVTRNPSYDTLSTVTLFRF